MENPHDPSVLRDRLAEFDLERPAPPAVECSGIPFATAPPLIHPGDEELQFAFAANLFELFRAMAHLPGALIEESEVGGRHLSYPLNPMFKGVWRTRVDSADADAAIDDAEAWFLSHSAPFAFWWVDPRSTPHDLGARLLAKGWAAWELNAPAMAADLDSLSYEVLERVPVGYRQHRVTDEAGMNDFRDAFVAGFEVPGWAGQAWVDATLAFGPGDAPWHCYVGYLDDEPVASNMLFNAAGVASVFGVATAPHARRRGIGAAITLIAYHGARQQGYRHGVLFGTETGVPVYRRIGFRDVDATISRYFWRAAP
jgi:GNAT superfamily N-acetyltransferase